MNSGHPFHMLPQGSSCLGGWLVSLSVAWHVTSQASQQNAEWLMACPLTRFVFSMTFSVSQNTTRLMLWLTIFLVVQHMTPHVTQRAPQGNWFLFIHFKFSFVHLMTLMTQVVPWAYVYQLFTFCASQHHIRNRWGYAKICLLLTCSLFVNRGLGCAYGVFQPSPYICWSYPWLCVKVSWSSLDTCWECTRDPQGISSACRSAQHLLQHTCC